jgi:methylmalonyl-CoA/ethylmalonyl-CoA epimerase
MHGDVFIFDEAVIKVASVAILPLISKEIIMINAVVKTWFKVLSTTAVAAGIGGAALANTHAELPNLRPYAFTMSVPNLQTTAKWYQDTLGFKVEQTKNYPEFKTKLAFLVREGFRIELIEDANAKPGLVRPDAPAHTATHGFAQFIFQTSDLSVVKKTMAAKGVPIHFEFENAELKIRIFFVRDPNGNLIAFLQRL